LFNLDIAFLSWGFLFLIAFHNHFPVVGFVAHVFGFRYVDLLLLVYWSYIQDCRSSRSSAKLRV